MPDKLKKFYTGLKNQFCVNIILSIIVSAVISAAVYFKGKGYHLPLQAIYFFCLSMFALLILNPKSEIFKHKVKNDRVTFIFAFCTIAVTTFVCIAPMRLNPVWSGRESNYRNEEYQELADALLEGHLNVHADEDTSQLMAMENPYDTNARKEQNIPYHWDHAFYKGKYYIYFGIVPAILLFAPYKVLTGTPLSTWKATAIFSMLIILAIFALGYKIIRKAKSAIPLSVWLLLSASCCTVILWYAAKRPILYCTAITSGLCFALWCIYFIFDAYYIRDIPPVWEVVIGAICGALVFGCRPPIGLCEIILMPLIISAVINQVKAGRKTKHIIAQAVGFAAPYIVVAVFLMLYNYLRFETPFEFGQSYQLTVTDQTAYLESLKERLSLIELLNWCGNYFIGFVNWNKGFPWVTENQAIFVMFPVLIFGLRPWNTKDKRMKWFHAMLLIAVIAIIQVQALNSPYSLPRYEMDFTFLICLTVIFGVIFRYDVGGVATVKKYALALNFTALFTIAAAFLLFFASGDASLVETDAEMANKLSRFFVLKSIL